MNWNKLCDSVVVCAANVNGFRAALNNSPLDYGNSLFRRGGRRFSPKTFPPQTFPPQTFHPQNGGETSA
ncbi:hypothetical protein DPMN_145618 [Dreissena polymorpha]|uniref:Uncharacterized protein n=1 Tax=Dreissena polymorpha TaxID=45954 RepID=A0A9D4J1I7_DREPO|nr:hypothetical protein DPMN_145618 [Dreissena polymorpha]